LASSIASAQAPNANDLAVQSKTLEKDLVVVGPDRMLGVAATTSCESWTHAVSRGRDDPSAWNIVLGSLNWTLGFLSASHDAYLQDNSIDRDLLKGVTEDDVINWLHSDCALGAPSRPYGKRREDSCWQF